MKKRHKPKTHFGFQLCLWHCYCCDLILCPWCHVPLWLGQTFSVKITFSVPLLLCVLQEARECLREAMANDGVTLNAELSASHDEKGSEKHGHIPVIPDPDSTCCFQHLLCLQKCKCCWQWHPREVLGTSRSRSLLYDIMSIMFHVWF